MTFCQAHYNMHLTWFILNWAKIIYVFKNKLVSGKLSSSMTLQVHWEYSFLFSFMPTFFYMDAGALVISHLRKCFTINIGLN